MYRFVGLELALELYQKMFELAGEATTYWEDV